MMYTSVRGELAPSYAHQQQELPQDKGGKGKKKGGRGGEKGGHPRFVRGSYMTTHDGRQVCFRFNYSTCED